MQEICNHHLVLMKVFRRCDHSIGHLHSCEALSLSLLIWIRFRNPLRSQKQYYFDELKFSKKKAFNRLHLIIEPSFEPENKYFKLDAIQTQVVLNLWPLS
jgi:hypothetical protein